MNGPEHYAEAQRLLANAQLAVVEATPSTITEALDMQDRAARVAQVHATLAQVAATVETAFSACYPEQGIRTDWIEAIQ